MESADLALKLTLYALFAWSASILIAAIPTNSKIASRTQWLVVHGVTLVGALSALGGAVGVISVSSHAWGWPWYIQIPSGLVYMGAMSILQWNCMKLSGNIFFDDKSLANK